MLDTNMLFRGRVLDDARQRGFRMRISTIVYAERLAQVRRRYADLKDAILQVENLLKGWDIAVVPFPETDGHAFAEIAQGFEEDVWKSTEERRHRHDRLIAACAVSRQIPLVTDNVQDFEAVRGLHLIEGDEFKRDVERMPA
ncbi:MAG: PIN domain-containing protein [Polyangiaceae bacterium]